MLKFNLFFIFFCVYCEASHRDFNLQPNPDSPKSITRIPSEKIFNSPEAKFKSPQRSFSNKKLSPLQKKRKQLELACIRSKTNHMPKHFVADFAQSYSEFAKNYSEAEEKNPENYFLDFIAKNLSGVSINFLENNIMGCLQSGHQQRFLERFYAEYDERFENLKNDKSLAIATITRAAILAAKDHIKEYEKEIVHAKKMINMCKTNSQSLDTIGRILMSNQTIITQVEVEALIKEAENERNRLSQNSTPSWYSSPVSSSSSF